MLLVKVLNGEIEKFPYTHEDLQRDNPHTSFPKTIGDELLASYSVYQVRSTEEPSYDPLVQVLERGTPVYNSDRWEVSYTATNKEQAEAETTVREHRNTLLTETDWMGLSDITMSSDMTAYRQALRDLPAQAGFPFSVTWPAKP